MILKAYGGCDIINFDTKSDGICYKIRMVKHMTRDKTAVHVERALYSEAMGRCMNPECQTELFIGDGDIIERAHIVPYCETKDNSFENLVILCPNCHTKFDKLHLFTTEQIREWKQIRKNEVERFFTKEYTTFEELRKTIIPILLENKSYFENYYLNGNKILWDKFEGRVLINNRKLKALFEANLHLFQTHTQDSYSNLNYIQQFIAHANEFEATRCDEEKIRQILFPAEVNSMFGVAPMEDSFLPSTESLEALITNFRKEGVYKNIILGIDSPYLTYVDGDETKTLFLKDTPRLRQLYNDYKCFRSGSVRIDSLNFAFTCLRTKKLKWKFPKSNNLREIVVNGVKIVFVYVYCLSEAELISMQLEENSVIVNLHGWNGDRCISQKAYEYAKQMKVKLMTTNAFRAYINEV